MSHIRPLVLRYSWGDGTLSWQYWELCLACALSVSADSENLFADPELSVSSPSLHVWKVLFCHLRTYKALQGILPHCLSLDYLGTCPRFLPVLQSPVCLYLSGATLLECGHALGWDPLF